MGCIENASNRQFIEIGSRSSVVLRFLGYLASNLHSHGAPRPPNNSPSSICVLVHLHGSFLKNLELGLKIRFLLRLGITAVTDCVTAWLVNNRIPLLLSTITSSFELQFRSGRYHRLHSQTLYPKNTCTQGRNSKKQVKWTEMVRSRGNEHEMQ